MGLGEDGHTASLFPGEVAILNTLKLCDSVRHPKTGQQRITLTPSAIKRSSCITYHVIGKNKSEIISDVLSGNSGKLRYPPSLMPGEWYLDKAAASKLSIS